MNNSGGGEAAAAIRGRRLNEQRRRRRVDLFSGPGFDFIPRGRRRARARRDNGTQPPVANIHYSEHDDDHQTNQPTTHVIDMRRLRHLFKKHLGKTDVSGLRRIVLPKKDAESYLPSLDTKQGISITMLDMDGIHQWRFKFRFWPNNSSRMYVLEGTGDFADAHDLIPGDCIHVYQDPEDGKYIIEGKKEFTFQQEPAILLDKEAPSAANGLTFRDLRHEPVIINEPHLAALLQLPPPVNSLDELENLVSYDATYDYEPAFLDDSPLEYQGDPIDLPSLDLNVAFETF